MADEAGLGKFIDSKVNEFFTADYVETTNEAELRAEALGIMVSKMVDWDGEEAGLFCIRALYAALEDANWNDSAEVAYGMVGRLENGESIDSVLYVTAE
jgi:hypothetical protein